MDEEPKKGSVASEIAAIVAEEAFDFLDAPIIRVGAKNGVAPQSHILEEVFLPSVQDIIEAAESILYLRKV